MAEVVRFRAEVADGGMVIRWWFADGTVGETRNAMEWVDCDFRLDRRSPAISYGKAYSRP